VPSFRMAALESALQQRNRCGKCLHCSKPISGLRYSPFARRDGSKHPD
jgi:hypothetical protein